MKDTNIVHTLVKPKEVSVSSNNEGGGLKYDICEHLQETLLVPEVIPP